MRRKALALFAIILVSVIHFAFEFAVRKSDRDAVNKFKSSSTKASYQNQSNPVFVILLSQYRSGSSFVGEIFNQNTEVAYFYEPLLPFGTCPRSDDNGVSDYFKKILSFDFRGMPRLYLKGLRQSRRIETAGCVSKGVCFAECMKCSAFLSRDTDICKSSERSKAQSCPDINLIKLADFVKTRKVIALKVVYLCDIAWIKSIIEDLNFNIKIVHLVRDPRALLNSRLVSVNVTDKFDFARERAIRMCQHLNKLMEYADANLLNSERYIRIRHEDFALEPERWTRKIYDFVNLSFDEYILNWLINSTSSQNSKQLSKWDVFGTKRNSNETIIHWRKELHLKAVNLTQTLCQKSMRSLGYVIFEDITQFNNTSLSSFLPP